MTRRLVWSYLAIALLVLVVLEIPLGIVFARSERRNLVAELKHDALALGAIAEETLAGHQERDIQKVVRDYEERTTRLRLRERERELVIASFLNPEDKASFAKAFGTALKTARNPNSAPARRPLPGDHSNRKN